MVLSISERAAAAVEGVDEGILTKIKSSWENTLNQVLRDFNFKQEIYFEYNPLIWHVSKYPIGIRIYRSIAGTITVIEFSTPNKEIPFDIFSNSKSKLIQNQKGRPCLHMRSPTCSMTKNGTPWITRK